MIILISIYVLSALLVAYWILDAATPRKGMSHDHGTHPNAVVHR